jgi:hypothetical protein
MRPCKARSPSHGGGSPRAYRAWLLAWPSPSGPLGAEPGYTCSQSLVDYLVLQTLGAGGPMPRSMVGLLAAVGTAMSALAGLTHGDLVWIMLMDAAAATGLAAYAALPLKKTSSWSHLVLWRIRGA